jgi:hypothetical protein
MKAYTLNPIRGADRARDAQCPDASWKPLSKRQKALLSILARAAAIRQGVPAVAAELDAWRRETSIRACGLRVSDATQAQWADLKSAFEDLGGRPEKAFQTQMREGDNKRRVAMHKLTRALYDRRLDPSYAAAICRAQFKCPLAEASAKQLWCLFYTVTNRRKKG